MSTHIGAAPGDIAPRVLFPGDPLRAKWIAETVLDDPFCYSGVRNMLGYTGTFRGERISVQGSGMGQPSAAVYATELFRDYGVLQLVRVGSCGALTERLRIRDIVIGISAATDSSMNRIRFEGLDYAATADYSLLRATDDAARAHGIDAVVGQLFACDSFYTERPELMLRMVEYGVVAVEMEANALYTIAAKHARRTLSICTVSDHLVTGEETSAHEREQSFGRMVEIALDGMLAVTV